MSGGILAVSTYGAHRVKDPATHKTVSAYKIGYTSAAAAVLLALYGERARNVSSRQASYIYLALEGEVSVHHGFILLSVNDAELQHAETISCRFHRAACYLWREERWCELPTLRSPAYTPDLSRSGPDFNPSGYRVVSTASGVKACAERGIRAERSQRSPDDTPRWWLTGETYPHRELLKRCGARFSGKRKAWYLVGWTLPEAIQQLLTEPEADEPAQEDEDPCSPEEAAAILGMALKPNPVPEALALPEEADPAAPAIRITHPEPLAEGVKTAVMQTPVFTPPQPPPTGRHSLTRIPQAYVGEVTGSITGHVYCYGYSVHEGVCIFLNLGGPRMAVEAIRAKLSKGEIVSVVPWDGPSVELTAGEGNTGMYHAYATSIPEARFTSLILCHDLLVTPDYSDQSTTFILRTSEAQAQAKLRHHVLQLVNIPVFGHWTAYLWSAGQAAMLVRPTHAAGGIDLLSVTLDADAWTKVITGGLAQDLIHLP